MIRNYKITKPRKKNYNGQRKKLRKKPELNKKNEMKNQKTFIDYLADMGAWGLGLAMFIYLGYRTLNFVSFTFSEQDQIYKWLTLFSTTIGAIIFAVIYKRSNYFDYRTRRWRSDEFKKSVSLTMMIVCFLGEAGLAYADMSLEASKQLGVVTLSEGELRTFISLSVLLAFAVGVAVAAIKLTPPHPLTDPEVDMSALDTNNNGIFDRQERGRGNQVVVMPQDVPSPKGTGDANPPTPPSQQ